MMPFLYLKPTVSGAVEPADPVPADSQTPASRSKTRAAFALSFVCLLAIVVVLQILAGAYTAELSGYPDEPAHHITGLMFDQYLREGADVSPMRYAHDFYMQYPKVAIGHWPPGLYILQALWTLLFSPTRTSYLLLSAIFGALLGALFARSATSETSSVTAYTLAAVFVATPVMQRQNSMIMADVLLTVAVYGACILLAQWLDSGRKNKALLFAIVASAAILTKGTGWLLVPLAGAAILLNGRPRLLLHRHVFMAGGIIAAFCVPWQILTLRFVMPGWARNHWDAAFAVRELAAIPPILATAAGIPLMIAAAAGVWFQIAEWRRNRALSPTAAAMTALAVTGCLFHAAVPTGMEERKLLVMLPALFWFAARACARVADKIVSPGQPQWRRAIPVAAVAVCFLLLTFQLPVKRSFGFQQAAAYTQQNSPANSSVLVSSESDGEGLLISELAFLEPRPKHFVIRASKLFATSDWTGQVYRSRVSSVEEVAAQLKRVPVSYIVLDNRPGVPRPHHRLLGEVVQSRGWTRIGASSAVVMYRAADAGKPVRHLELDLTPILGKILTKDSDGY